MDWARACVWGVFWVCLASVICKGMDVFQKMVDNAQEDSED